jgi:multicomponent Na+:H+ antiporter subunit D
VHIISQVGYITLALSLKSPLALAAGLFYLVHNMVAKTGLFLVGGVIESSTGSRDSLKEIGGFFKLRPLLSVYFLVLALGLAGLPPLSGFFAKFFVLRAAAQAESYGSIFWILIVGVFTIFSMLKIWNEAFWKAPPEEIVAKMTPGFSRSLWSPQMLAVGLLAFAVLAMGLGAQPLFDGALRASEGLLRNEAYVNAVLGPLEGGGDAR